jgi:hypothetical protein
MNKFLIVTTWLTLALLVATIIWICPWLDTYAPAIGIFIAAMLNEGLTSWKYHKTTFKDKEFWWKIRYFGKSYGMEIRAQLIAIILMAGLAWLCEDYRFWRFVALFIAGMSAQFLFHYIIEWFTVTFLHIRPRINVKDMEDLLPGEYPRASESEDGPQP